MATRFLRVWLQALAVVLVSVGLISCGGDTGGSSAAENPPETGPATSSSEDGSTETSVADEDRPDGPTAECVDESDDVFAYIPSKDLMQEPKPYKGTIPGHGDLQNATLTMGEESAVLRLSLASPKPVTDDDPETFPFGFWRFGVLVDGMLTYALAGGTEDGLAPNGLHYSKKGRDDEVDLASGSIAVEDSDVIVTLPLNALPELRGDFRWGAIVSVGQTGNSSDPEPRGIDQCPNLPDDAGFMNIIGSELDPGLLKKLPSQP